MSQESGIVIANCYNDSPQKMEISFLVSLNITVKPLLKQLIRSIRERGIEIGDSCFAHLSLGGEVIPIKSEQSINRIIQVNDLNIGKNIAGLRKSLHIKQIDMVAKLQLTGIDVSIYSYNRIEKGTQNPTVSFLLACCRILDCDMNDIFYRT